jgi:hypothetical protein
MANNTLKTPKSRSESGRGGFFRAFESLMNVGDLFKDGVPVKILPHIVFMMGIGIFYIGNRHYAEKNIRQINILQTEVQDMRADFTTLKADYMYATKQSEVVRRAKKLGLRELDEPPFKIEISLDEY